MPKALPLTFAGAVAFLAGCASSTDPGYGGSGGTTPCTSANAVSTTSVTVVDHAFQPSCILVSAGSTVTWTDTGMPIHTVTSDPGTPVTFDSGQLGTGGTFQFTFPSAGTVNYHCTPHQSLVMVGTVIVM